MCPSKAPELSCANANPTGSVGVQRQIHQTRWGEDKCFDESSSSSSSHSSVPRTTGMYWDHVAGVEYIRPAGMTWRAAKPSIAMSCGGNVSFLTSTAGHVHASHMHIIRASFWGTTKLETSQQMNIFLE